MQSAQQYPALPARKTFDEGLGRLRGLDFLDDRTHRDIRYMIYERLPTWLRRVPRVEARWAGPHVGLATTPPLRCRLCEGFGGDARGADATFVVADDFDDFVHVVGQPEKIHVAGADVFVFFQTLPDPGEETFPMFRAE